MYTIGITGGIACGKSTAAHIAKQLGASVIDADQVAKRLTAPGGLAAPIIIEQFGTLDRKELAKIIFNDAKRREQLNSIVHPLVRQEIETLLSNLQDPIAIVEIPLLYESGMEDIADEVWVVYANEETQIQRLMLRNDLSREEAILRVKSQMPIEEKAKRADYVIDNDSNNADIRQHVEKLWRNACQKVGFLK